MNAKSRSVSSGWIGIVNTPKAPDVIFQWLVFSSNNIVLRFNSIRRNSLNWRILHLLILFSIQPSSRWFDWGCVVCKCLSGVAIVWHCRPIGTSYIPLYAMCFRVKSFKILGSYLA